MAIPVAVAVGAKAVGGAAVKAGVKVVAKEAGKAALKEVGKQAVKEVGKQAAKEAAKNVAKEAGKAALKDATKEAAIKAAKEAAKDAGKDYAKSVLLDGVKPENYKYNPSSGKDAAGIDIDEADEAVNDLQENGGDTKDYSNGNNKDIVGQALDAVNSGAGLLGKSIPALNNKETSKALGAALTDLKNGANIGDVLKKQLGSKDSPLNRVSPVLPGSLGNAAGLAAKAGTPKNLAGKLASSVPSIGGTNIPNAANATKAAKAMQSKLGNPIANKALNKVAPGGLGKMLGGKDNKNKAPLGGGLRPTAPAGIALRLGAAATPLIFILMPFIILGLILSSFGLFSCSSSSSSSSNTIEQSQGVFIPTANVVTGDSNANENSASTGSGSFDGDWCYYDQTNPNWDTGGISDWGSACGVCAFAMVASSYSGDTQYNPTWVKNNGLSSGNMCYFDRMANYINEHQDIFGLQATQGDSSAEHNNNWKDSWDSIVSICNNGGCVIVCLGSLITSYKHYVVITKVENGQVYTQDSNGGCEKVWNESDFRAASYGDNNTKAVYFEKI